MFRYFQTTVPLCLTAQVTFDPSKADAAFHNVMKTWKADVYKEAKFIKIVASQKLYLVTRYYAQKIK